MQEGAPGGHRAPLLLRYWPLPGSNGRFGEVDVSTGVLCSLVGGDCDGDSVGDSEGDSVGDSEGVSDGFSLVGVDDGVSDRERVGLGVQLGWTAAPWSVSRSNLVFSAATPKVDAAQICAGKPPPLTRSRPAVLYSLLCPWVL